MQTPKDEIRNNILAVAREEFSKNGFERASIRTITAKAKTSKSNVYNYFKDKDALFHAVVEPTLSGIREGFRQLREGNGARSADSYTITAQKEVIITFMTFVLSHGDDFKLLFFNSWGSSLSGFKGQLIDSLADILEDWVKTIAADKGLSRLFIRSVAGFYINTIEQLLLEDKTRELTAGNLDEFLRFVYGGWNNILKK